ncbi:hypothetical protein IRT45_35370 [Nocardia sp. BSTN01]|uniref:hypothetical protein n=1 Tax=Nocardia sp. BSTN01 TaxID=2783665 RepID=UPI001890A33D|nr:hypothetical protein [Nocardia sp. BSTN01]MBF5002400.1 hypothetical protein [Nocardia sp. BSTN01]
MTSATVPRFHPGTWEIDQGGSSIPFTSQSLIVSEVCGETNGGLSSEDFAVNFDLPLDDGDTALGDKIKITLQMTVHPAEPEH